MSRPPASSPPESSPPESSPPASSPPESSPPESSQRASDQPPDSPRGSNQPPDSPRASERAEELAPAHTAVRPRLIGIAYALLGSRTEAEDVVSDCWLRLADAASRARVHVAAGAPRLDVDAADHRRAAEAFQAATMAGDLAGLLAVLDPDVVLTSDGGGLATAARRPVLGADRVARFLLGVARRRPVVHHAVTINGQAGYATTDPGGQLLAVCALTVRDSRVVRVDLVMSPAKLPRTGV